MTTILTIILVVLIIVASIGLSISVHLVRVVAKKTLKLRKETKVLRQLRTQLESAIAEVETYQQVIIDQAIRTTATEMEAYLKSMLKEK